MMTKQLKIIAKKLFSLFLAFTLIFGIFPLDPAIANFGGGSQAHEARNEEYGGDGHVPGEVLAPADSEEHALAIAAAYGLELKSYAYGIAVLSAANPELAKSHSILMRQAGIPGLSLNRLYSLFDYEPTEDFSEDNFAIPFNSATQWHHGLMETERAWGLSRGSGVIVAVIDTGIDISHPAFSGRIQANSYNAFTNQVGIQNVRDDLGHGTNVAGVIAASSQDVSGVAPDARLLVIKANIPTNTGFFDSASVLRGINYSVANGADIINMSFGTPFSSGSNTLEHNTIINAVSNGVTVVCASGNSAIRHASFPAAYPEAIAVSSVRQGGIFDHAYSNYGPEIDIAAPGTAIISTAREGRYETRSGTSLAAPNVSGAAALVKALNPHFTPAQVRDTLTGSSRQVGALGRSEQYGFGVLNAYAAALGLDSLYSVTFDFGDGLRSPVTARIVPGSYLSEPEQPQRSGYAFVGWFLRSAGGLRYDFGTVLSGDTTLYARWAVYDERAYGEVFPDPAFRTEVFRVLNQVREANRDSPTSISVDDSIALAEIDSLHLSNMGIFNLKGLERFIGLVHLECDNINVTELDVSNNPALETLIFRGNQLTRLDISKNNALRHLDLSNNRLTALDVSANPDLQILRCFENNMGSDPDHSVTGWRTRFAEAGMKDSESPFQFFPQIAFVNAQMPVITAQPLDTTVTAGMNVTLSVTANAADGGTLSYQWHGNTINSNSGGTPVIGATAPYFSPPTSSAGIGYYYVTITNTNVSVNGDRTATIVSTTATVTINPELPIEPPPSEPPPSEPPPSEQQPPVFVPPPSGEAQAPANTASQPTPATVPDMEPEAEPDVPLWENPFADIGEDDWFFDAVRYANQSGLFGGLSETEFSPNGQMTRAMFATVLYRMENGKLKIENDPQPSTHNSQFSDVAAGVWYYDAVAWAADNRIVSGLGVDRFGPDVPVTREQIAVMLMNYVRHSNSILRSTVSEAAFADDAGISGWARDSVGRIQRAGIIGGKPGNLFDPQGVATRAEVATIFARLSEVLI